MYKLEEPFALLMLAAVLLIGLVLVPLTDCVYCTLLIIPFAVIGVCLDLQAGTLYGFRKVNSFTPLSDELVDDDENMLMR